MFCWVWWYCVPRLRTDFVPCVQKGAIRCWPVPTPFGGSFGGKSARRILTCATQINAQLWFHWEKGILISQGSRKWKAQRTGDEILLSSKKLYTSTTPQHSCTPPPSPRETPLFGYVRNASTRCLSSLIPPQNPRFPGIFYFTAKAFTWTGFPCTGKSCTNK